MMTSFMSPILQGKRKTLTSKIVTSYMYRPLHIAAKSGLVGVVKDLINRGADLNVRDAEGMIIK